MLATVKRAPRAALTSLALAALLAGCGGGGSHATNARTSATTSATNASPPTPSTTTAPTQTTRTSPSSPPNQAPPNPVTYGHLASASEQAAVTRVVRAYYAALSSSHEVAACALLTARIQHLLQKSIGRSPLLHGKGCVGAFKLLFGHHGRASAVSPTVSVTGVRVQGNRGYALFSTQSLPSAQIRVEREHGTWKVGSLIGTPLGCAPSTSAR